MDILGESLVECSHGDVDEDRQWLDIENGIGNVLGVRESECAQLAIRCLRVANALQSRYIAINP